MAKIVHIAVAGGPGSGKTTICRALQRYPHVVCVREAPSVLGELGIWNPRPDPEFDRSIDDLRLILEREFRWKAKLDGARAVVADRLVGEGSYVYSGQLTAGVPSPHELVMRYDAIVLIDMPPRDVWEAIRENNRARTEQSYVQACRLHGLVAHFISTHPRVHCIGNTGGAEGKTQTGVELILQLIEELSAE